MKIGLIVAAVAMMTGCGAAQPAAPANVPVSATTLSSAALTPSSLAPAAWDGEEPKAAVASTSPTPTWGGGAPAAPITP
jgi:hypothetical protein